MTSGRPLILPSGRTDWETPHDLFDQLDAKWGPFTMDAAAAHGQYSAEVISKRGGKYCIAPSPELVEEARVVALGGSDPRVLVDAFEHPWTGIVFVNPPYGRGLYAWVEKAFREVHFVNAKRVVMLLPAYTGVKWWQDFVVTGCKHDVNGGEDVVRGRASSVDFLPGRLKFVGAEGHAGFASAVVVWQG